jgi:putative toxin-antitoxin system antitoxin component (TIGR02293 family)
MNNLTDLQNDEIMVQIQSVRNGFPAHNVANISKKYQLNMPDIADMLGLTLSSLRCRVRKDQRLKSAESERLFRLARVARHTADIFSDPISAGKWLSRPHSLLDQATPLSMLDTAYGEQEVERILYSIEYGLPV